MSDLRTNVRFTWQLVSQFVSWEFCRYMCEQKEDIAQETDVLTFLRNMIVQRTEKSMSEITKHEIVAKFIMETKEVQNISRMSCIVPLSESVKKIFPELEPAVSKLVHYLENFLTVLDSTVEDRKEIIHLRIEGAVNDFIKEANRLLPQPHLLQIIECWSTKEGQPCQKPAKKVIYNAMLLEKVLECFHVESVTAAEAKAIAISLYEDKVFEKILRNFAEAEQPETEAESELTSLAASQPSDLIFSQEFVKNSQAFNAAEIPVNLQPPNAENHESNQEPDSSGNCAPMMPDVGDIPDSPSNEQPPYLIHLMPAVLSPPSESPPVYPFVHRNNVEPNEVSDLRNNETPTHMQFAQSSANESQSEDGGSSILEDTVTKTFKRIYMNQRLHKSSDPDTSDCDKNEDIRFLTPTLFKKTKKKKPPPKPKVVYLSDTESDGSSIVTAVGSSQQNDPNWSMRHPDFTQAKKAKSKKKVPPKKTIRISSDSSDEDDPFISSATAAQSSASAAQADSEHERPIKKRRVVENARLYGSPNMSIQDFVSQIRRPNPIATNEVPVHAGTNTRLSKKKPSAEPAKNASKKQKCKQCSKAFKTVIALRRHVFLKHTEPVGGEADSDCDS